MEGFDLIRIKNELEKQRGRIRQQIDDMHEKDQGSGVYNPDRDDLAYQFVEAEMQKAELVRLEERLSQIEAGLERIKAGQYGVCERCGEKINPARLRALPYAILCIKCQEQVS